MVYFLSNFLFPLSLFFKPENKRKKKEIVNICAYIKKDNGEIMIRLFSFFFSVQHLKKILTNFVFKKFCTMESIHCHSLGAKNLNY